MNIMSKKFNITGICIPEEHYMVNLNNRLVQIKKLIDDKEYFTINRGRQYGKTTTLSRLRRFLADEYTVIFISFEGFGHDNFSSEAIFCQEFLLTIDDFFESLELTERWHALEVKSFSQLSRHLTKMCKGKKVVLMIDEVDKASNYQVFLSFLSTLRKKYLARADQIGFTFHSVILAGVYDIKNIKLKMISDGLYVPSAEERQINSPWNIAVPFEVDMSFSAEEISGMLLEYDQDYHTCMDIVDISKEIYSYTSGYPFLVSQVCKLIDEALNKDWTRYGVSKAVKLMIKAPKLPTLFDDLNIKNNQELANFLYNILLVGEKYRFAGGVEVIDTALRYDFIKVVNEEIHVHNKIFEILITDYFVEKERISESKTVKNQVEFEVLRDGKFNIELFFEKFNAHYQANYANRDVKFLEREACFLFLFFLQPYLNTKGKYFLENQSKSGKRMDVIVIYGDEEFVIELKIWKGQKLHEDSKKQLLGYMTHRLVDKGYLLTFDFRKKLEQKQEWMEVDGKKLLIVQV